MIVAMLFVEFIFYSFLGWVWESIYCTIMEKKWADRGFLFWGFYFSLKHFSQSVTIVLIWKNRLETASA